MERVPGTSLNDIWSSLSYFKKVELVKTVARYTAQLFKLRFNRIGNLFRARGNLFHERKVQSSIVYSPNDMVVSRLVSLDMFWKTHFTLDVSHGPFYSSKHWLETKFKFAEDDCRRVLEAENPDEDDIEDFSKALAIVKRLQAHMPSFFRETDTENGFTLFHGDISRSNVIVDGQGKLMALVDWECVSVLPLWKACDSPEMINSDKLSRDDQ